MERVPDAFENPKQIYKPLSYASYDLTSGIVRVDPLLNDVTLWDQMYKQVKLSKFKASIGSTHFVDNDCLVSNGETANMEPSTDD